MLKILFLIFSLLLSLNAQDLKPSYIYTASGGVTQIISQNNKLYIATQTGIIDIFNIKTKKLIHTIKVPQIKDFMGDIIDAKIYSVDVLNNNILMVAQHTSGFRELYLYKDQELIKILTSKDKLYISKAVFIDNDKILFSLLGNEMILYDTKTKKNIFRIDVRAPDAQFNSTFADFAISEDKKLAVVADESGDLKLVDIQKAKVIKVLANRNLDKVFKVDIKNNKIITAGQDGRCVVYNLATNKDYFLREAPNWFIIYGAGLSPSGEIGAYSSDENNNVTIFNTQTKKKLFKLKNNLMTLTSILFINENEVFIGTDSNKFNYYRLK